MNVLKNTTCPKCGEPDALTVCATMKAVNCACCFQFIRALTMEEIIQLKENLLKALKGE